MNIFWGVLTSFVVGSALAIPNGFDAGFKFHDAETQEAIIKAFKEAGIVYQVQPDGSVSYLSKDEKRVSKIKMDIVRKSFPRHIQYYDKEAEQRFLQALDNEKISYEIKEKNGSRKVYWNEEDNEKVKEVRKKLSWDFSIRFSNSEKEREQKFLKTLEDEKIAYSIVTEGNRRLITWSKEENEKVEDVLKKLSRTSL